MNEQPPLTPAQKEHWERQLEAAERAVEVAKRMLGRIAVENGHEQSNPS